MKKAFRVEVTKEDIKNGKKFSLSKCPIALAIKRATNYNFVQVGSLDIIAGPNKQSMKRYNPVGKPGIMWDFIKEFDYGNEVKPTHYHFELTSL